MPSTKTIICWSCRQEVEIPEKVMRADVCPKCEQPLKCCYNCRFYDRNANQQCAEPQAEWVRYKEKANFCDYFTPSQPNVPIVSTPQPKPATKPGQNGRRVETEVNPVVAKKDRTKAAWNSLFKE